MTRFAASDSSPLREWGALLLVLVGSWLFLPRQLTAQAPKKDASPQDQTAPEPKVSQEETIPPEEAPRSARKTYNVRNGTASYGRSEETERKNTPDGEIEVQRVRMPSYGGDNRVLMEREVRTKKLPDGTVEKEYVLKNPDGANRLVPVEIIRERIRQDGDSTTIDRQTLKPDYAGHWQPTRKERVTEAGPDSSRQTVREVREPNVTGDWKLTDREVTTEKSSEGSKESRSVRQVPDAYGRMADYEVRQERKSKEGDKETTDVTVRRRDTQGTDHPRLFLVEHTRSEETKAAGGKVTRKTTTESDLVAGGASRNVTPGAPKVAVEKVEEETPGANGGSRRTVSVKQRGAADRELRPAYQVVQETDKNGNVRQVFIPAR